MRKLIVFAALIIALASFGACSSIGNSDLTLQFDKVITEDGSGIFTVNFQNNETSDSIFSLIPSDGQLLLSEVPKGDYTVTIDRYGVIETFNVSLEKAHHSFDYRYFADTKGSVVDGNHFIIATPAQLLNMLVLSTAETPLYYHLGADIDMNGISVIPAALFKDTLDGRNYGVTTGQGFAINNLTISSTNNDTALFGINEGIIQNLIFNNVNISGGDRVAAIAATNKGLIDNCDVIGGQITANDYAGGIAGTDEGLILECTSTVSITCTGYFGRIAGISYSDVTLGAYGIRPATAGETAITAEMDELEMYLTALDNWYAMDNRSVLQSAEVTVDFSDTVHDVINGIKSAFGSYSIQGLVLNILLNNDIWVTEQLAMRRIYEGAVEDGLSRMLISGTGYTKATSFDTILNALMAIPQFSEMLADIDIKFPFAFAGYYNEEDNERVEILFSGDAVENGGKVDYEWGDEVITVNITDDLNEIAEQEDIDESDVDKILAYIAEAKEEILTLSPIDMEIDDAVKSVSDSTYENGIYKFTLTLNPNLAFKYIIDRIQRAMDEEFLGTTGEGTTIEANFAEDPTLTVEIWDNGNLKSLKLNGLDVTFVINLTPATQAQFNSEVKGIISDMEGNASAIGNYAPETVEISVKGKLYDSYSYSRSDTEIDIYLNQFNSRTKVRALDKFNERNTPESEA
jgi:hypothetical protein